VAPFKAQNMALNSYITPEGGEMGRAQVVQAEAAGIEPHVDMNPILLKPTSHVGSQVIVRGKSIGNFPARDYYEYKKSLVPVVRECYERLASEYDVVVVEGAGSAVELNLKEHDLVNMAMAEMADARCILVGDIDRGGIFAALIGSLMLLTPNEQERIAGFVVNKLRGDATLFDEGVRIIEEKSGRPVLGVIPHFDHIAIQEEDSVALARRMRGGKQGEAALAIGVVRLPFISNYTDFDCFEQDPDVRLSYFDRPSEAFGFDAVILPGSKNTLEDLDHLKRSGMAEAISAYYKSGGTVVGLCGGYQMLGMRVTDPHGVESSLREVEGFCLLDMETEMYPEKVTTQVEAVLEAGSNGEHLCGYEIHMGRSEPLGNARPLFRIVKRNGTPADVFDGLSHPDGRVWGTYIHGIFDNDSFRRSFLESVLERAGRSRALLSTGFSYRQWKDGQYDLLADHVRRHMDVEGVYRALGLL
ncbi:MAG: cobyric acid synthase, partial [Acidobacteriota bacterium]